MGAELSAELAEISWGALLASRRWAPSWAPSSPTPREVRARRGPATAHGMGELVAKVGYSGRHGRAPLHK